MIPSTVCNPDGYNNFQVLWEDGERIFCRMPRHASAHHTTVLAVLPSVEYPTSATVTRLAHEYGLRDELDAAWAARPLELIREGGRTILLLEDTGCEPLDRLLGAPMETGSFLRLAISIVGTLGKLHGSGLIHKDLKPTNILVNPATGEVKLTGFGFASRLPRERSSPDPPETIAGTLAYMAPEQTGRMNRSIDSRSDLYALGITFYQMLTGSLPFRAAEAIEWIHCHIARTPQAPCERAEDIPAPISEFIMKLLAKTPEDRYQTAAGLEQDLRRCLSDWEALRWVDPFSLGKFDIPNRLLIPEKLYGREHDIDALLAAFDSVLVNGAPELVLVSGYSGIGKSAVVNELHKVLVLPRGLFAAGKFDQYKREIPYATLAQAFQALVRQLLGRPEAELANWHENLVEALGPNGALIVDLVPELKLIIGEQPPIPELPPQQARGRFQLVFRRFIGVFARSEHPLALFLDDLQWLDAATLELIEDLSTHPDVRHLLLIGAYRDNEVSATHPLMRRLEAIRKSGAKTRQIALAPLHAEDLTQLVADSLHCDPERAAPLAQSILEKTAGNPFFSIQFLSTLVDEELLTFDHAKREWRWDESRIEAQGYTDNVVDLMVGRLGRLPAETQEALRQFACLGNSAEISFLSMVHERSEEEIHKKLWEARRAALIIRSGDSYNFAHDRIQHAAYRLIPEEQRSEVHLRIGRLLAARISSDKQEEVIFDIVNQLNRGAALITLQGERDRLAQLNLIAGKRAKASAAYVSGLSYLVTGASLLSDAGWDNRPDLMFALELHRAECEFLTGKMEEAQARLTILWSRAANAVDRAAVACLQIDLYTTLDRSDQAVDICLSYLRHLGIECSPHPTEEEARREYERTWSLLGRREIDELIDLPLMGKPEHIATLDLLSKSLSPARFTDLNLFSLLLWRMVNLSLEHGNSDASCHAYVHAGGITGPRFGNYKAGFQLGRLGYDLTERRGLKRFKARTHLGFAVLIMSWINHWRISRDSIRRALDELNAIGDIGQATYSWYCLIGNLLAAGDPLAEVQREAERGLQFAEKARFGQSISIIMTQLALIRTLRGLTGIFGCLDDEGFDEVQFERRLSSDPGLGFAACWYWIRKLQARFFAGDYAAALEASVNAQRLLGLTPSFVETAEAHFFGALCHAVSVDVALPDQYRLHVDALIAHHKQLLEWTRHCPENFENRAALVGAEIARIEGRELDAERLYEAAIKSARKNGFVHNEALAYERAAHFYAARGLEEVAHVYLQNARNHYLRWGADGKVRQLEQFYPQLRRREHVEGRTETIEAPLEHLDLATVIRVSQAVSGEIALEKLIDRLMRTAIEQGGAERGLLIVPRADGPRIAAEATTNGDTIVVNLRDEAIEGLLPLSVLQYVLRTHESVIIDDAKSQATFAADPFIRRHKARSILCLPLLNQAKLIGALFLENRLAPGVFEPAQITVLRLVSSQAAIALENSRLYEDLQEREAKIRRLIDANIIGIFFIDLGGRIIEANDAFLQMLRYEREDLVSGRLRWTNLTPPEWRAADERRLEEVKKTGRLEPFEKEYFRKDGSRVPVLVGVARFEESSNQAVAFVIDLTERKQAELEARESERRFREAQTALAHASRVATLGEISASIAHEVNQPLAAIVATGHACLRFLGREPPDLDNVRGAVEWMVKDGNRAAEVIRRVRDLLRKSNDEKARLDVNGLIDETAALLRHELAAQHVTLALELAAALPEIFADRIQIQQVIINLVMNGVDAMKPITDRPRKLVIRSHNDGAGNIFIAVKDGGVGIPTDNAGRVFDTFYSTKPGGLGIGLSLCRSIISDHHGRLWTTNNSDGVGATFYFALPTYRDGERNSPLLQL